MKTSATGRTAETDHELVAVCSVNRPAGTRPRLRTPPKRRVSAVQSLTRALDGMPRVVEKSFGFLEHYAGCINGCVQSSAMSSDELVALAERFKCTAFVVFISVKQYDRYIKLLTPEKLVWHGVNQVDADVIYEWNAEWHDCETLWKFVCQIRRKTRGAVPSSMVSLRTPPRLLRNGSMSRSPTHRSSTSRTSMSGCRARMTRSL